MKTSTSIAVVGLNSLVLAACAQEPPSAKGIVEVEGGSRVLVQLVRQVDPARGIEVPYAYGTVLAPFKAPITKVEEVVIEAVELYSGCIAVSDSYTPVKTGLRGAFAAAIDLDC